MARKHKTLAALLNAERPSPIEWYGILPESSQTRRDIGHLAQVVVQVGLTWTWLVIDTRTGRVLMGESHDDATPLACVDKMTAAMEVADAWR